MAGEIRVNTEQVEQIAGTIEKLNGELRQQLERGQKAIKNLGDTWQGEAAQATTEAFDSFAAKYFEEYYEIIDQYVVFLRNNVAAGYFETETANTQLADAFK